MVAVVGPSSGGSVLANFSSVCQFLVTEVRRATTSSVYEPLGACRKPSCKRITRSVYERVFLCAMVLVVVISVLESSYPVGRFSLLVGDAGQ